MKNPNVWQYAKSTDQDVIDTIFDNLEDYNRAQVDISNELKNWGDGTMFYNHFASGGLGLGALVGSEKPEGHGKWAWLGKNKEGVRPAKNNPIYARWRAMDHKDKPIPGAPGVCYATDAYNPCEGWFITYGYFIFDGVAYARASRLPDDGVFGEQWEECTGSEVLSRLEILADRRAFEENSDEGLDLG